MLAEMLSCYIMSLDYRNACPLTPLPPLPQGEARRPLWGWRGGGSQKNRGLKFPSPGLWGGGREVGGEGDLLQRPLYRLASGWLQSAQSGSLRKTPTKNFTLNF